MRVNKRIPIEFIFFYQFYQEHVEQLWYLLKFLNEKASTKAKPNTIEMVFLNRIQATNMKKKE